MLGFTEHGQVRLLQLVEAEPNSNLALSLNCRFRPL